MFKNCTSILFILSLLILVACRPQDYSAKPKGYFKIDLPQEHTYQKFDDNKFPFSFEYPTYAKITQDTNLVLQENAPFWINVNFIDYNATIYLSYKSITDSDSLQKLIDDSYTLSYKHEKRADYIRDQSFTTKNGLTGYNYNVGGNAASAHQFYVTDSKKHFVRGALYFEVVPNADSLQPAIEFLNVDMQHLINTLNFKP